MVVIYGIPYHMTLHERGNEIEHIIIHVYLVYRGWHSQYSLDLSRYTQISREQSCQKEHMNSTEFYPIKVRPRSCPTHITSLCCLFHLLQEFLQLSAIFPSDEVRSWGVSPTDALRKVLLLLDL